MLGGDFGSEDLAVEESLAADVDALLSDLVSLVFDSDLLSLLESVDLLSEDFDSDAADFLYDSLR